MSELKIFNGTSHDINLYRKEDTVSIENGRKLILKEGATPYLVIPAGKSLNAIETKAGVPTELILKNRGKYPLVGSLEFTYVDELPTTEDGSNYDIYIVSAKYKAAVKDLCDGDVHDLATVSGTVYKSAEELRPCGCIELSVG